MQVTLATVSDFAYVEHGTGKLYILGQFKYLFAPAVPATHPRMAVVFVIEAPTPEVRAGVVNMQVEMTDGDGRPIMPRSPDLPVRFVEAGPGGPGRSRAQLTIELGSVNLPRYGDYAIHLFGPNNQHLGDVGFNVAPAPRATAE